MSSSIRSSAAGQSARSPSAWAASGSAASCSRPTRRCRIVGRRSRDSRFDGSAEKWIIIAPKLSIGVNHWQGPEGGRTAFDVLPVSRRRLLGVIPGSRLPPGLFFSAALRAIAVGLHGPLGAEHRPAHSRDGTRGGVQLPYDRSLGCIPGWAGEAACSGVIPGSTKPMLAARWGRGMTVHRYALEGPQ